MVFRRVILVLILGVLTTIVVAWGIVLRVRIYPASGMGWPPGKARYVVAQGPILPNGACRVQEVARYTRPGRVMYISFAAWFTGMDPAPRTDAGMPASRFVPSWMRPQLTIPPAADPDPGTDPLYRNVSTVGWPMPCLWHSLSRNRGVPGSEGAFEVRFPSWLSVNKAQLSGAADILPYRVIALPFMLNTGAFAAAWFGIVFGITSVRRSRRRRRGGCVSCGYDLSGSVDASVCPECGGWSNESTGRG